MTPPPIRLTIACVVFAVCGILAVTELSANQLPAGDMPATPAPAADEQIAEVSAALERFKTLDFDGALSKLKEAVTKHPKLPPAEVVMASWFASANQPGAVRLYLESAIRENPNDPEAYVILGDVNLSNQRDRRVTEAALLYTKAATLVASVANEERKKNLAPRIEGGLAAVAAARADWATAQNHLEAWLKLDPESDLAMRRLAVALFKQAKAQEALEQLKAGYELNPKTLHWAAMMARFYAGVPDEENAKKWMTYALSVAPDDLAVWLVAAQWSLETRQLDDAEKQAATAMRIDPNSLQAKILRGVVALFREDFASAEVYFESAVSQSPSNFAATNNLALALCEQTDDTKKRKAVEYATNNARLYPRNSEAASTYGWVLYKAGKVQDADKVLSQLARSGRVTEDTAYFIARVAFEMGRKDEAKAVLQKALKSTRPFSKRKEAEQLQSELGN